MNATMILSLLAAVLAGAIASGLGWSLGRRRGAQIARASAAPRLSSMSAERDAADRRAREATAETARWKAMSLAGDALSSQPIFESRPAPRDAEELARMVRGLAFVDDVIIADRSGYPLTRESMASSPDLAALAPHVAELAHAFGLAGLPVTGLHIETADAVHVRARSLSGRCEAAILFVQSTSQPVSALVIDAVGHASARTVPERPARAIGHAPWVASDRQAAPDSVSREALATLDRALDGSLAGALLMLDGKAVFSSAHDGPSVEHRAAAAASIHALASRARATLRASGVVRIDVSLRGEQTVTWSSLPGPSHAALITFGRTETRSAARLDVFVGKLRRALDTNDSAYPQGTAA